MQSIIQIVDSAMPRFNSIAERDKLVLWSAESQFAVQLIEKNPYLLKCEPTTIRDAVINVAAVGLTLNPADGYAYLVPEYNKNAGRQECQLRVSFKGLIKVANDSGAIQWVTANTVKEGDDFIYNGVSALPEHKMKPFSSKRGKTIGVFCVAKTHGGDYLVEMMALDEIDKIKDCAKTKMVWDKWPDEMAKKAVIKRAAKQWPKSGKSNVLHEAIRVINETEGSDDQYLQYTPEQKEQFDLMIDTECGMGLLALKHEVGVEVYINLYNSGEAGDKVRMKEAVKALTKTGLDELNQYDIQSMEFLDEDDIDGFRELVSELSVPEKKLLNSRFSPSTTSKIERLMGAGHGA